MEASLSQSLSNGNGGCGCGRGPGRQGPPFSPPPPPLTLRLSRGEESRVTSVAQRRRRHVFQLRPQHPPAPGGAAQTGGRCGEDPGLSSSCRTSAILYAECLQRCLACGSACWKQPLSGAQVLHITLKGRLSESSLQVETETWQPSFVQQILSLCPSLCVAKTVSLRCLLVSLIIVVTD